MNDFVLLETLVILDNSCLVIRTDRTTISLDPTRYIRSDFAFVSHAHVDHLSKSYLRSSTIKKVLTSKETFEIAHVRGFVLGQIHEGNGNVQLVDTGHILGSRGLLINNDLFYTGDISIRERAFMKAQQIPKVKTLIIESTFGKPQYVFPSISDIIHETNKIISHMYDRGIPVLLMGYPLGKAQLLEYLFEHWEPFYSHDSVAKINFIYRKYGVPLRDTMVFSEAEKKGLLAKTKPWVMVCPIMHSKSTFVNLMKKKYGAVSIGFSGWALDERYGHSMGFDYSLPMSDHCDFLELLKVVESSGANKIYTFHGFSAEFAKSLKNLGFDAEAVNRSEGAHFNNKKLSVHTLDSFF